MIVDLLVVLDRDVLWRDHDELGQVHLSEVPVCVWGGGGSMCMRGQSLRFFSMAIKKSV